MWGGLQPDPGEENPLEAPNTNLELRDLKDQFDQQQVLIAQLKEMLRKSEQTAGMQEKVEEYANTLTRMNARFKKNKHKRDTDTDSSISVDTPAKEKILLLRQQMEENRLKLAERGKLHKGIEETVTQLKAQLDDSQNVRPQASINVSSDYKEESYSINSSQEELVNVLIAKDKRINDLNSKIHKLKGSVLDLQENVKEKDSVIDARTKAITLMTESLSKKGKNTLDALDDTKEQMRKMQENFVNLEAQMKSEKEVLENELLAKTAETERLEKLCTTQNEELQQLRNEILPKKGRKSKKKGQKIIEENVPETYDSDEVLSKIAQYEATIIELNLRIEELKAAPTKLEEFTETIDISKLKKQLEENNKCMIKVKAQHKSKIKELNKTIEELRKDKNETAEVKQLQEENANLVEQVSKLTSNIDLADSERVNDLEMKLLEQSELVETKNHTISSLEGQITLYKNQVEQLKKFACLENDQVVSEIQSIDFEEQLDKVKLEKEDLQCKFDEVVAENLKLLETIDNLSKEKQELSAKLDNYIQENIELIDKLEKLSSAKVSSAESIEIVEGLTQQEKLELEEYQKGLEIPENIKSSVENLETSGLNESVNQLTEETSDLLRKIELFTEERREVMEKMEALATENTLLNTKISEVENNRDVLVETYEQVQNEKEDLEEKLENEKKIVQELESSLLEKIADLEKENKTLKEKINEAFATTKCDTKMGPSHMNVHVSNLQIEIDEYKMLVEIQKQEIQQLKVELLAQQNITGAYSNLQDEISALKIQYQKLLSENELLAKSVKNSSEILHEKDSLEVHLIDARKQLDKYSEKLNENLEELENYKSILEENKNELISSANIIVDLQNKVHTKQNEVEHYESETERLNIIIAGLSNRITNIENENCKTLTNTNTIESMSNQLQGLKDVLNENLAHIEVYENEIQANTTTINELTLQLKDLKVKLDNMEKEIDSKNDEINKLLNEQNSKESLIVKLNIQLKEKDHNFYETCEKLKQKCIELQNKIDENTGTFDKLDLPKMQELEVKNKEQLDKMKKIAASLKKKNIAYQELENKYEKLDNDHKVCVTSLQLKTQELRELQIQNTHLRTVTEEAQLQGSNECNDLNLEIDNKNDLINALTGELERLRYDSETSVNALHVKTQELEMFIETQESELCKYKEQVNKLEEGLSALEERRESLERQTIDLGNQLQEKSDSYEEISHIEDMLEQRLATLVAHDKKMEKLLRDSTVETQKLQESNKYLLDENDLLKQKLAHALEKNVDADKLTDLEHENQHLNEVIHKSESECRRHCTEYEIQLSNKSTEVENMEIELQGQLMQLQSERKSLIGQCEQLEDQIKDHLETQELLHENIEEYKNKLTQQQADFDEHLLVCQKELEEHKNNLNIIDQLQITAVGYNNEIEHLNKLIKESNLQVENFSIENKELILSNQGLQELYDATCKRLSELEPTNIDLQKKASLLICGDVTINPTSDQGITNFVWPTESTIDPFEDIFKSQSQPTSKPAQSNESNVAQYFGTLMTEKVKPSTQNIESQTLSEEAKTFQSVNTQTVHSVETNTYEEPETLYTDEFISPESSNTLLHTPKSTDEANEQLVNKIKTLEFMLFNVEKKKEEALSQCQELTGHIARLIYENQMASKQQVLQVEGSRDLHNAGIEDLKTQIIPSTAIDVTQQDLQELRCMEFGNYKANNTCEDICEAKSEYLCYPVDPKILESQIVPEEDANITKESLQQLHSAEFTKCKEVSEGGSKNVPIPEVIEAKTAYLCFPTDDAFDENDDGWGCGTEEAKLEADYHQEQLNQNTANIYELNLRICSLEADCEKHREEHKQSQIKFSKLLKKVKEYKTLNDKLETELRKSGEFAGLEDALQDEFKIQIGQLEKRIKEITIELEKERNYKNNLTKQLDVLHSANERMVEMKEKQDFELLNWQRENRELSSKLEQFEWGDGDSESPKHELRQQDHVNELNSVINELTKDNEELQILLEEQRNLRIIAEKRKIEGIREEEYLNILADRNSLKDDLAVSLDEKKALQDQLNYLKDDLTVSLDEKKALQDQFNILVKVKEELEKKLANVDQERATLENEILNKSNSVTQLSEDVEKLKSKVLEKENEIFLQKAQDLEGANLKLKDLKLDLEKQVQKVTESQHQLVLYEQQIHDISNQLQAKTNDLFAVRSQLEATLQEKSTLTESIQLLNEEWSQRVDQRGADVAESWKKHLETRETEFSNIHQNLQKEMNELEEKCNALVNENNELRKNVDAEIRNEIDKISALQQQINDRQQYINDLTKIVQDKQTVVEQKQLKINEYEDVIKQITEEKDLLILNINEKIQRITELEQQLCSFADLKNEMHANHGLLTKLQLDIATKNKLIEENIVSLSQSHEELEEYRQAVALFQQQVESKDLYISELAKDVHENQTQVNLLQEELKIKTHSITKLEETEFNDTTSELKELKDILQKKEIDFTEASLNGEMLLNAKIEEFEQVLQSVESNYKQMLSVKEIELENVKVEFDNVTQNNSELIDEYNRIKGVINDLKLKFNDKTSECEELQKRLAEQELLHSEESKQVSELGVILEDQVFKIEALKQELFEKSKDYDSLIAELDIRKPSLEEHPPLSPQLLKESQLQQSSSTLRLSHASSNDDTIKPITRAELDLALYLLHQRDVQCEELNVELRLLLEERDTLQLKLSNAIREREDLRKTFMPLQTHEQDVEDLQGSDKQSSPSKVSAIVLGASGTEIATEATEVISEHTTPLANKLLELKRVGYGRDKTILDEQDQRRLQQLILLQEHRDVGALLPPEAVAKLVHDANYTLSRDVQSPSKVLLNWLWGRSTPKVDNV